MSAFEWIALVGAAAWLPHIGGLLYRWLSKPLIKLIPGAEPEVGYTGLGPILNILCAISVQRKDAVIERIEVDVTHEKGQVTRFVWNTLNETFSQLRSAEGTTEVVRNQPAIALKVSTLVLAEKLIGFQDPEFHEQARARVSAVAERRSHFERTEEDPAAATLRSKEFADLVDFYRRYLPWRPGKYTALVRMQVADVRDPFSERLTFELTTLDVDRLQRNLEEIERYLREMVAPPEERANYAWNWLNPPLRRLG